MKTLSAILFATVLTICGTGCQTTDESWKRASSYWFHFQTSVDSAIQRELSGKEPGAGKSDWNDYWRWRIEIVKDHPDGQRCEDYVIEQRRKVGLPDLKP